MLGPACGVGGEESAARWSREGAHVAGPRGRHSVVGPRSQGHVADTRA